MSDARETLPAATIFPDYDEWVQIYDIVKDTALLGEGIEFCRSHPGTVNNRKQSVQGNTMMHQAGFWGATTVLHALKELGADPTLRNFEGKTAADMSRNDTKKAEFEAAVESVFGSDDGASRRELLTLAKNGAFVEALGILNRKPHLINTQSHISGWTVLHQAAFHGCSRVLFGRLLTSGACPRLRGYFDGRTPLDVLQEHHPDHPAIADLREREGGSAGDSAAAHATALVDGGRAVRAQPVKPRNVDAVALGELDEVAVGVDGRLDEPAVPQPVRAVLRPHERAARHQRAGRHRRPRHVRRRRLAAARRSVAAARAPAAAASAAS